MNEFTDLNLPFSENSTLSRNANFFIMLVYFKLDFLEIKYNESSFLNGIFFPF